MSRYPQTTIHDLPVELYLQIGSHFTGLKRNTHLASLALGSHRWCPIAQEWLLKVPRFKLTYIDKYLWEIAHHSQFLPQIRSLELHSSSEDRVLRNSAGLSRHEYVPILRPLFHYGKDFLPKCEEIVEHFGTTPQNKVRWLAALDMDLVPALFGVLLCILHNLRESRIGNTWLMDMPIFRSLLSARSIGAHILPSEWRHDHLQDVLSTKIPRLEVLDVPADTSAVYLPHRASAVFDFPRFTNLRELGMSIRALWLCHNCNRIPSGPREVFSASLQVLRISEADDYTPCILQTL